MPTRCRHVHSQEPSLICRAPEYVDSPHRALLNSSEPGGEVGSRFHFVAKVLWRHRSHTARRAHVTRKADGRYFVTISVCTERAFSRTQSTVQYVQLNVNIRISQEHFQVGKFGHPPCGFWRRKLLQQRELWKGQFCSGQCFKKDFFGHFRKSR